MGAIKNRGVNFWKTFLRSYVSLWSFLKRMYLFRRKHAKGLQKQIRWDNVCFDRMKVFDEGNKWRRFRTIVLNNFYDQDLNKC